MQVHVSLKMQKKVRRTSICKNVARLKPRDKLNISCTNRVVGKNYGSSVRHLGISIRDRNLFSFTDALMDRH